MNITEYKGNKGATYNRNKLKQIVDGAKTVRNISKV